MTRHNLVVLLAVLFVIAVLFGGFGGAHYGWGYAAWSPAGLIIVAFILVLLLG